MRRSCSAANAFACVSHSWRRSKTGLARVQVKEAGAASVPCATIPGIDNGFSRLAQTGSRTERYVAPGRLGLKLSLAEEARGNVKARIRELIRHRASLSPKSCDLTLFQLPAAPLTGLSVGTSYPLPPSLLLLSGLP